MKSEDFVCLVNDNLRQMVRERDEMIMKMYERENFLRDELASQTKIIAMLTADLVDQRRSGLSPRCTEDSPIKPTRPTCRHGNELGSEWEVINRTKKTAAANERPERNRCANERRESVGDNGAVPVASFESPNRFAGLQQNDDESDACRGDSRSAAEEGAPGTRVCRTKAPFEQK